MKYLKKFNESTSEYPTVDQLEDATPDQILRWHRFLPSPSSESQVEVINKIFSKYKELSQKGDIDSNTSKRVGWGN